MPRFNEIGVFSLVRIAFGHAEVDGAQRFEKWDDAWIVRIRVIFQQYALGKTLNELFQIGICLQLVCLYFTNC